MMLSYERQPGAVRALLLLGGLGMVVAPFLKWSVLWDIAGRQQADRGIESSFGILVLIAGAATVACGVTTRLAPLGILTGLIGGASAGTAFLDILPMYGIPDMATQPAGGIIVALGSAALAGAGGVVGLAVAAAAQARERA